MKPTSQNNKSTAVLDQTSDIPGMPQEQAAPLWSYFPIHAAGFVPSLETAVAALPFGSSLLLYCLDKDNQVFQLGARNSTSWSALDLTEETGQFAQGLSNIAATRIGNGQPRVYCLSPDNKIHEFRYVGEWLQQEIIAVEGGPIKPAAHTPLAAFTIKGLPRVYFVSADNRVHELDYIEGKGWVNNDLIDQARKKNPETPDAQPLTSLAAFAIMDKDLELPRVYFLSEANQIWELSWDGHIWKGRLISGSTPVQGQTALVGMAVDSKAVKDDPRVYYIGDSNAVHQASYDAVANEWINSDLSGPLHAAAHSPLACVTFGTQRVYYVANDASVHQIELQSQGPVDLNLTSLTGNKFAAGLSTLTATLHTDGVHVIYNASITGLAQFFSQQP